MDSRAWTQVFVYGSLLQGEENHHFLQSARCLGEDRLLGLRLYHLGRYPMICWGPGWVKGERYQISLQLLSLLDELEDHPHVYRREWLQLQSGTHAWIYVGRPEMVQGYPHLPEGDWRQRHRLDLDRTFTDTGG